MPAGCIASSRRSSRPIACPKESGHQNVYATYVDRSGAVWLGTWGKGASRIDPVTGRVTILGAGDDPSYVNSFYEDRRGRAVDRRRRGRRTVSLHAARDDLPRRGAARAARAARCSRYTETPTAASGSGAAGLLLRYDGQSWTSFPPSSGAPEATVRAFATTRDGALWMGTNGGGLARYREGTFTRVTRADGLPSDLIRSLYEDADGWLWVGTEGRGLARLDPREWGGTTPRRSPPSSASARRTGCSTRSSTRSSRTTPGGCG